VRLTTVIRGFVTAGVVYMLAAPDETVAQQSVRRAPEIIWEQLPPLPDAEGFAGAFAGVVDDTLVVAGGANIAGEKWNDQFSKRWFDSAFLLEPRATQWKAAGTLLRPCGYGVSISFNQTLVCIGGSDAARHYADVFQLTLRDGRIVVTPLPPLPRPCANACGALLDQTIYVAGGIESPGASNALHTFWALDLRSENLRWRELEPWPGPARMLAVAAAQAGSFFLMSGADLHASGGKTPTREYLRDAWRFTPGQGWKRIADLPRAAVAAPSPAIPFGTSSFLIISGDDGEKVTFAPLKDHPGFPRNSLAYDPTKNVWTVAGESPLSRATVPCVPWRNSFVIPNGEVRPRVRTNEVWTARFAGVP
jgi:N-acetylneuraminic acid mutarotase